MSWFIQSRISISRIVLLLVSALFLAGQVMAATQGILGSSSTASFLVSLTIPVNYKISGMNDFSFGQYTGSGRGNMSNNKDLCIYTNSYGAYSATITDSSSRSPSGFFRTKFNGFIRYPLWCQMERQPWYGRQQYCLLQFPNR
jgi:spore coat protein U-like protein